ncbi:MAG: hypothetical protein WB502_02585 [Thermoactinomyces sp.]
MSLPAGFEQIDLFEWSAPKPKHKRRQKSKSVLYHCPKCKRTIGIDVPVIAIVCGCGRRMITTIKKG